MTPNADSGALMALALYVKDLFDGGHFNGRLGRLQQETLEDYLEAALPPNESSGAALGREWHGGGLEIQLP